MMRIAALSLLVALAAAPPTFATDKDLKDGGTGQYVNVSPVAAPIVLNGQLINYVFVTLRLTLARNVDASKLRDREPYFRDAFVRAAHRSPFVKPGDYTHVDEAAIKRTMMAASTRIAGPGVVTGVEIVTAQPQRLTGLPKSAPAETARAPIP